MSLAGVALTRFFTPVCMMAALVLLAGCHDKTPPPGPVGSQPSSGAPSEDAWVGMFKKELARTEQRFYQSRYIQKQDDPFYLKEVLPRLGSEKQTSKDLKKQIAVRRDDFEQSWPLLTDQLERTQTIFAVTSVVSSFKATVVLARALPAGLDVENAGLILKFRELVEKGAIVSTRTQTMDLAPELRNDVLELAHKIGMRTLALIGGATAVSNSVRSQLHTLRNEIRLLNVRAAESAGQPVSVDEEPFIASPIKVWKELRAVYDEIFSAVAGTEKGEKLRAHLARLQAKEAKLLEALLFATEKQFKLANLLTDAASAAQ
ncbi:MAG: hypothetical protein HY074_20590 [Deltaproteobacteria bacterium]|nr:hypothetical protein [Deltaproteobacteria bacterium]